MPASVSPVAAELYRRALVIDGDVLGEIGFPISTDELVTDALLKRGYKSAAVEKILGGNFKRVFADIWSP